ncbi:hypothetical protein ACWD26_41915 [Streptomyces sp. NPDC002787]
MSVDTGRTLATVPTTGVGMNVAVHDGNMNHFAVPGLLRDTGVGVVRYPGGGYATGAQPIITADHGSGTPEEAAGWVRYATAMKAVDPTVEIGAVLTTPGAWPDGITGPGDTMDGNHMVLSIATSKIDFVVVRHYPIGTRPTSVRRGWRTAPSPSTGGTCTTAPTAAT